MKSIMLVIFFTLSPSIWSQSLSFSEKTGFIKLKTGSGSSINKLGKDTLGITYIRASQLSSIQVIPSEDGRIELVITTNEIVSVEGGSENKKYKVEVQDDIKSVERIIDRVINEINIVQLVDRKNY